MGAQLDYIPDPGYLRMIVRGDVCFDLAQQYLAQLSHAVRRHPHCPVLVDAREASPTLSPADVRQLAGDLAEADLGTLHRVAIWSGPRPGFDHAGFLSELAAHRGLAVRRFFAFDAALAWLTE